MTIRLDCRPQWHALGKYAQQVAECRIETLFRDHPDRWQTHSVEAAGVLLDFSRQNLDAEALRLLLDLAQASDVAGWRKRQFRGDRINVSDDAAVLHTALRAAGQDASTLAPESVQKEVKEVLDRMEVWVASVRSGQWCGHTLKPIRTVVHIGIGGSHLGPAMVCQALYQHDHGGPEVRFVANMDAADFQRAVRGAEPETTLFVLASKSFATPETMHNAQLAAQWLGLSPGRDPGAQNHWIAVTGNHDRAVDFGILSDNIFPLPDWVGGRFSLWSAMGIPIALRTGMKGFRELLGGAYAMDQHFLTAPFARNLPVLMAMTGIWNRNFLGISSQAVVPYIQSLELFPMYLQQMEMESNGKRVTWFGEDVSWATCPVIWGAVGTHAQHTFFQQLHQGSEVIPVDFIVVKQDPGDSGTRHRKLLVNAVAQSTALMTGQDLSGVRQMNASELSTEDTLCKLDPHRVCPGNRPSNMVILDGLTPKTLGALIALYEHKVFVQGVVWQVGSFDQWGVEFGKQLAADFDQVLSGGKSNVEIDYPTRALLSQLNLPVR